MGVQTSSNRWLSLVLILVMMYLYINRSRFTIWLKYRIDSWREATMLNDVNYLKSATPSLSEVRFCACSKTAS